MRRLLIPSLLCTLLASGCSPELLTPAETVSRFRVLAVKAEPAEIAPGESTTFRALLADNQELGTYGEDYFFLWSPCIVDDSVSSSGGCANGLVPSGDDPSDFLNLFAEEFEYTADDPAIAEALAGLEERERLEGVPLVVNLTVVPGSLTDLFAQLQELDPEDPEAFGSFFESILEDGFLGLKRIDISDKSSVPADAEFETCAVDDVLPNVNPELPPRFWLLTPDQHDLYQEDDTTIPEDARFIDLKVDDIVRPETEGESVFVVPQLPDGFVEDYVFVNRELVGECRREEPTFAWYSTAPAEAGFASNTSFIDIETGAPRAMRFRPPETFEEPVDAWLVVRDRRGGVDWVRFRVGPALPEEGE